MLSDEPKDAEAAGPGPDGTEAGGLGGGEEPPPKTPEPLSFSVSRHPFRH
jgi:hypothetical protein